MKDFTKKLKIGTHVISLPIDKKYKLEELFDLNLTGSFIEKLDSDGNFKDKEKVLFENNEFIVSKNYKMLKPFDILRLTLKREITINWSIGFKSNTSVKKEQINIDNKYDKQQSLTLMQLSSLVYEDENKVKNKILKQYDFDSFEYFSKQNNKKILEEGYIKLFSTFFKSKTDIVDLQFMKLIKYDEEINKDIIILVFQGSQEPQDWISNLTVKKANYSGKYQVHQGFYDGFKLFLKILNDKDFYSKTQKKYNFNKDIDYINNNCKIILTGHSLGGALATLAACYFHDIGIKKENMSIYTFGAPPVGDEEFCQKYKNRLDIYRVVNKNDVIPKIDKISKLKHLGLKIKLKSKNNEIHSCNDYINNLIEELNN